MAINALMTELEAVNLMLAAIGEAPVNTITNTGLADVDIAKTLLDSTVREVQERGWWFNREHDYPITPDVNDNILVPSTALRIDLEPTVFGDYDLIQRGSKMYDRKNHTYTITDTDLKFDIVFLLTWDELPQSVRYYMTIKAARVFQNSYLASEAEHKFTEKDEFEAKAKMQDAELEAGDNNFLTDSVSVAQIHGRFVNPDW